MKKLFLLVPLLFAVSAHAADVTVEWSWPTAYCDGTPLDVADIDQAEVYIDTSPITASSDIEGNSCASPADIPPDSEIVETVTTSVTSVDVELAPGHTYYVRMRVQVNGRWSNLSAQAMSTIEYGMPDVPILIRIGG